MPILYITGDKDELVPLEMTLKLFNLSEKSVFKDLYIVKDGEHNDSWHKGGAQYISKLQDFLIKCIMEYEIEQLDEWGGAMGSEMLDI